MKFSVLVFATAVCIATANAIRGFDVGESCTAIKAQATCEERACRWDVGKLHHHPKLICFHCNLMPLCIASNACTPVPGGGRLRNGVAF